MTKLEKLNEDSINLKKAMELIINLNSIKVGSDLDDKARKAFNLLNFIHIKINKLETTN